MKILVVQKILRFAGSEIYLLNLLPALREMGIDARFALLCDDEGSEVTIQYKQHLINADVPTYVFKLRRIPSLAQLKKINAHLIEHNYDLVHTNLVMSDMCLALIKTLLNKDITIVSTKHGYQEKYNNEYGFNVVYRFFDAFRLVSQWTEKKIIRSFAVSKALRNLYIGLKICPEKKIDVIYHGFDFSDVEPLEAFRYAPQQIVMVGRLTAFKGHRFAIRAMKIVTQVFPQAKLLIVGDGPLNNELNNLVHSLNLSDNVVFTGFHSNPRQIIASSDVVVLPSVAEAFGLVILEAMATRKPIAAFHVPTPSEILEHGKTALLAKPFSVEDFANNIMCLLQDDQLKNVIAHQAYHVQKENFNQLKMVTDTIAFYRKVLPAEQTHLTRKEAIF